MILEKGSRLVMAGDSVTDCGRNRELLRASGVPGATVMFM